MRKLLLPVLLAVLATGACKKDPGKEPENTASKLAPDNFTYATTKKVDISIRLLTNDNQPIKGVLVNVTEPGAKDSTTSLFKAVSNNNGYITGSVTVPSYLDTLVISPNYIGLLNNVKALVKSTALTAIIGGKTGFGGDIIVETTGLKKSMFGRRATISNVIDGTDYVYPNGGDDQTAVFQPLGKPKYLEAVQDNLSASLLHFINSSLPEGSSVPTAHPEYLLTSTVSTLNITKTSDVLVTYVYEGASYKNTIAYYVYPTNAPPERTRDISTVTWVFPNASGNNAGGALASGDKVKLKGDRTDGKFSAGMSIGFLIVQNE